MEIRKATGLDTDTRLEGIIKSLDKEIEYYRKMENKQLNRPNTPEDQRITWADLFKGKDYKFDDQQEYDQLFSTMALNKAILGPQRVLAGAYLMGYSNPNSLRSAIFGESSNSDILDDVIDEYNKILAESNIDYDLESDVTSISEKLARQKDKREIEKKAAWKIINNRLNETLQRRKIANRIFEEEGPITPATIERNEEQAEQQQEEQQPVQEPQPSPTLSPQQEAPLSDAEKRLNQKYNHTKGEQKTLQERVEERRNRMKKAQVEDGLEVSEEEETPVIDDGTQEEPVVEIPEEEVEETPVNEEETPVNEETPETEPVSAEESETEPEQIIEEQPQETGVPEEFDVNEGEDSGEYIYEDEEAIEQSVRDAEAATAELEEEADVNATLLDTGWVMFDDYSGLEFNEERQLTYDG